MTMDLGWTSPLSRWHLFFGLILVLPTMKSPFPGMDPYLEKHWGDIHSSLIIYARDQLQGALPGSLFARVEERIFLESEEGVGRSMFPDVRVVEYPPDKSSGAATVADVAVEEPILIHCPREQITESYIEIIDAESGNRVITVIEILSPSNKTPGESQTSYLKKQRECQEARVSLVDIDLLRTGQRKLCVPVELIPRSFRTLYQICVHRASKPDLAEVYAVPLQKRLPSIRIPLRQQDQDVRLHLQDLLDQAYHNGRYARTLDYKLSLDPPLPRTETRWARQIIKNMAKGA